MTNFIIAKIAELATQSPNRLCFDSEEKTMTYKELNDRSNALANYFSTHLPKKQPVALYGGLDIEMIVGFIACMKSGRPYIPIDKHTPANRLKMISAEAGEAAVLALAEWPLAEDERVITREEYSHILLNTAVPNDTCCVSGDDIVYIIFTSGTTGKPKGVQISYTNLMSYLTWMLTDFHLEDGQRFLTQAPYSFDLSVMAVYPALTTGGCLVPLEKEVVDDFQKLFHVLPHLNIHVWVSTPSLMEICLLSPEFRDEHHPELSHFLFCGEELPHTVAETLKNHFPQARVFNTYGPTEATVAVTSVEIDGNVLASHQRLPLGVPKPDTEVLIMDDCNQPQVEGEVGEIVIVGPSVSKGYINNAAKTDEAFFTYQGKQAYRTGDAGYIKHGLLFYSGRTDFQIKWHGYRMELGDIDCHLANLAYIRQACVVPRYRQHKVQQLVAYVVKQETADPSPKRIKDDLGKTLMDYMIPQQFKFVDSLPLTSNGKIDRKYLINEVNSG
ncbi:D-alanine--poly(phosphoribitol) ligase subunit DltA [Vagococcus acidifermentans]|uniref:D-alanine--D-alanyl carrier protein ligase n=1 Tax=Vagococcus acidifermentans TaxID=564710 RepID=A0A430B0S1_9ENTE|nr:D-alanine--poly(phosphoribitol) ligase subunit DltA [Vagococcus acidifermentans]RSU13914.1 D-alanine--poly(phosphoribitol) ligase subunit 1 [Vagococcus acidifermentans]